jgi:rSAM/selenodomain-associated transferase 1
MEDREAPRKPAAPFRCRLVVMAKAPMAGAAKTRLARGIGLAGATRFARQAVAALLQRVAHDPRWHTTLAVSPDASVASRWWPASIARAGQGRGDLGRRMQGIMECWPPGPVVIVGTDIPGITPAHIAHAFRLLGRHDGVFGPAIDGGYWLVGMRRRPRLLRPFAGVRWSGPEALADTLANLEGSAVAFVATLGDVDDAHAFNSVAADVGRRVLPRRCPPRCPCPTPPRPLA